MAMNNKLKEYTKEELEKLPKELREAIDSFDFEKTIQEISENNKLTDEETLALQVETVLMLVGLTDPRLYKQNIEANISVTENEVSKIVTEIIQKIFTPIADTIAENIKKSGKVMNSNTEQNLNFILSGGDYSTFLREKEATPETPTINKIPTSPMMTPSLADIKANAQKNKITDINGVVRPSPEGSTAP